MTSDIIKELRQLAAEALCDGSFAEVTLNEAATIIESQAKELAFLKSQNERLVKALKCNVLDIETVLHTLDETQKEAKALLAEIKP